MYLSLTIRVSGESFRGGKGLEVTIKSKDTFPIRPLVGEKTYHKKASEVVVSSGKIQVSIRVRRR